jgi:hypothetical protein
MSAVVMSTLYRIVQAGAATTDDFLSRMMLGFPLRDIERARPELWAGLSMFDDPALARDTARTFPQLGRHIVAVNVAAIDPRRIVLRQTGRPGHFTVWAAPATLLGVVMRTWPV